MSRETLQTVERLSARITHMTIAPVVQLVPNDDPDEQPHKIREPKITELLRRVTHLVTCDDQQAVIDGYSSTTPLNGSPGAGKGGGRLMAVPGDHDGLSDYVPTSSTESAAFVRGTPPADPVHTAALAAVATLHTIVSALERLDAELGRVERLRLVSRVPDPPQCWWIRQLGLPWDERWEPWRATDFPKLKPAVTDEPVKVCRFVYWFARDHHRLPTKPEALKHLERTAIDRMAGQR